MVRKIIQTREHHLSPQTGVVRIVKSPWLDNALGRFSKKTGTDAHYLLYGGGAIVIGQVVSALFALVLATAMANLIPKETYGTYKYILSIVSILAIPTLGAMATSVTQSIARGEFSAYRDGLLAKLSWGLLGSAGALAIGSYYLFMGNLNLGYSFFVIAVFLPLTEAFTLWSAVLAGKKLFPLSSAYGVLVQGGTTIVMITTLFYTKNVYVILLSYFASYTLFRYVAHKKVLARFPELSILGNAGDAVQFGKRMSIIGIFSQSATQVDSLLVWHLLGPVPLAIYSFALATTMPMKTLLKSVTTLALPKYSEKNAKQLRRAVNSQTWKAYIVFIPITIIYISLLPILFHLLFPQYLDSLLYAQTLGLTFLFYPLKLQSAAIATRMNRTPIYLTNFTNSLILAISFVIGIYFFGLRGAVGAILLQGILASVLTYYFYRKMN